MSAQARYPFVAVDIAPELSDDVSAELFALGASGVEERDDQTLSRGAGSGKVTLVASFATHAEAEAAMEGLRAREDELAPRLEEVVGDAWRDAWKEHFAPFPLTPKITVAPPWVKPPIPGPGEHVLTLEPGRAFGTGLHASTALVSEMLEARAAELAGAEILDVGTGSGILALVALVHGARHAVCVDVDADVVEIVRENAARNGLADRVVARAGGVEDVAGEFPWVLANIEARVLRPIAVELARRVAPGGRLVLSGLLASEEDEMIALYEGLPRRLELLARSRRGEAAGEAWVALAFAAPG